MATISNLSDLEIEVTFTDKDCKEQPVPDHSFYFEWFTTYSKKVIFASYDAETKTYINCKKVGNKLLCFFDSPELGNGRVKSRKTYFLINPDFPDKTQKVVLDTKTNFWIGKEEFSGTKIMTIEDESSTCIKDAEIPIIQDCAPILWYYQYTFDKNGELFCTSDGEEFMVAIK